VLRKSGEKRKSKSGGVDARDNPSHSSTRTQAWVIFLRRRRLSPHSVGCGLLANLASIPEKFTLPKRGMSPFPRIRRHRLKEVRRSRETSISCAKGVQKKPRHVNHFIRLPDSAIYRLACSRATTGASTRVLNRLQHRSPDLSPVANKDA